MAATLLHILRGHNGKSVAHALRPAGAADAMDIVLGMLRHVVVDHVADLLDVDAARGDIGGHHDFVAAVAKSVERLLALALGAVGMQHRDGMALLVQPARDAVGAVLGAAENQHLIVIGAPQQLLDQRLLLLTSTGYKAWVMVSAGERRWPISMVSGLRSAHLQSCSISGGIVAENNMVWRVPDNVRRFFAHRA